MRSQIHHRHETTLVIKYLAVATSWTSVALRGHTTAGLTMFGALAGRERAGGRVPRHPAVG